MDDAQGRRPVRRGDILKGSAGYVREPLVDVGRCSFTRRAPDQSRHGIDELLKLPLVPPPRLLGMHLIVYVVTQAVPLDDAPVLIPQRLRTARHPVIDAICAAQ